MKHLKKLVIIATSFVLLGVACTTTDDTTAAATTGNWVKSNGFDGNGRAGAVSFVIGDVAYVGTGFDGTIRYNDFFAYDPTLDTWSQKAVMVMKVSGQPDVVAAKRNSAAAFAVGTKGYVTTGYDGINKLQDTWEYDAVGDTWTKKADFPDPVNGAVGSGARYGAVGFGILTKGYVCSGYTGSHTKDLWEFNPATNVWTAKASMNTSDKRTGAVALVYGDKAYIVSGSNNGSVVTEMAMYDPATNVWTKKRDIANLSSENYDDTYTSIVRSNAVGFVIGTKGYLTTGENGSNLKTTWEYDFATDVWTAKTSFERSDRNSAVGFAVKGKGFVTTGRNSTYYFDNMDEFKPNDTYNAND
jgi:hypothetical protein